MRFVVALAAVTWVGLLLAGPLLPAIPAAALYGLGAAICHQIPERSFHLAGFQLPVCARCFGLYLGACLGAVAYVPFDRVRRLGARLLSTTRRVRVFGVGVALPTLVTIAAEQAGIWAASNVTRAVAGVPAGLLAALLVMNALATLHYDECALPRPTAHTPPRSSM